MNFEDFPKNMLLLGLFMISIITFGTSMAVNYHKDPSIITGGYIDTSRIEQQLNKTNADAEKWAEAFKSDNLFVSAGAIVLYSIWGIAKTIWTAVTTFLTLYLDLAQAVLGFPPIVTSTITALVLISLIFAGWKLVKSGE